MDQVVFYNFPAYLFYLVYLVLTGNWGFAGFDGGAFGAGGVDGMREQLWVSAMAAWATFKLWSTIISLILGTFTVYAIIRLWQVKEEEKIFYAPLAEAPARTTDDRWEHILILVNSEHPSDWRQAVIEADRLLEMFLAESGFPGDTVGERLKSASGLRSINNAWEAHKVRNNIAHGGTDFILTQRDARGAIENYSVALSELSGE